MSAPQKTTRSYTQHVEISKRFMTVKLLQNKTKEINKEPQNETAVSVLLGPEASVSTEFNQKCATNTLRTMAQWTMAQLC